MMKLNFFKHANLLVMALVLGFAVSSCKDDDSGPTLSDAADITAFSFAGINPPVAGVISGTTITATVPYDVDVTTLVPTIAVSERATIAPASGVARDFSQPVTYTVTAENGTTTRTYTVNVTQENPPSIAVAPLWQRNLAEGGLPAWFTANNDRDLAVHGNFVYVHNNNDKIRVVSAADGTDVLVREDLEFIDGKENFASGNLFLLGTDTDSQGRIVASNLRVGSADQHPWNVYVWNDKDAEQELLFQYPTPEGYRLGENLTVVGDVRGNATIYVPGGGFGTQNNKMLKFTISGGEVNTTPDIIELGEITNMGNAPDVVAVSNEANSNLIVAGTGIGGIAEYTSAGALVGRLPAALNTGETALLFSFALDVAAFELSGRKIVATTATDFTENAATSGYLYLIDYTDGWDNVTAANIERVPFTPDGNIDTNFNGTGGVDVVVSGNTATVYAVITNFGIGAYTVTIEQ
ncbi:DUF5018 domain-containing protein [Cesiribacter andamanensis]|nr:DUF5018 domain-containing protein [Cesiribacter andamanensis]